MKKLLSKVPKLGKKQPQEPAGRITTDTLAEHREKVLAGGRKFKYPVQYQRHKLVINALIIGVAALILVIALGWYMLYVAKNTSEFMYRVTKVVPVPVAYVDGQPVNYSDYLLQYRGQENFLIQNQQVDVNSVDGKAQLVHYQSEALRSAIADAYAKKLAKTLDITVTDAEVEAAIQAQREASNGAVTEATQQVVLADFFGWTLAEYREIIRDKLFLQKVSYAVDEHAETVANEVVSKVKAGTTDLKSIADGLNSKSAGQVTYIGETWVDKTNQDGGLTTAAAKLKKGQISGVVKSTLNNEYYYNIVKLVDVTDTQVKYSYIQVTLKEFDAKLQGIDDAGKITRFIKIEDTTKR